ncbi:ALP1-like protein [Tanacetum coccineum]
MGDSFYFDTLNLDDQNDIKLIMQAIMYEQSLKHNQAESSRRHQTLINRERDLAEALLMADYFGDYPKYPDYYFRRRYRMNRSLFLEIVQRIETYIQTVHPLPDHFKFFVVRLDATGLMSFSVIMKCTSDIRQLAYDTTPDALDEYLQMEEHCTCDYCTNYLKLWHEQFGRGDKKYPTIMHEVEAVASYDLWIWHAFFEVAGANNDLIVLNNSPLFEDLLDDIPWPRLK